MEKLTFGQKLSNFGTFLFNRETSEILGRTCRNWGAITLFYIIYYIFLSAFFAACFSVFYTTLDDHFPKLTADSSLLRANPGMGFKPMPFLETTLIRYDRMVEKSYKPHVDHIKKYIDKWSKLQNGFDVVNCSDINGIRMDGDVPCTVDLNETLATCGEDFGYREGKPCILLKLNRIFDWVPQPYDVDDLPGHMPESLKAMYDQTKIWISCDGENPGDNDNLGTIEYLPTQGFNLHYFPYKNQKGYAQPLIFARLSNIQPNVGMLIECKAWAKNIWHDRMDRQGSIHFEIIVD